MNYPEWTKKEIVMSVVKGSDTEYCDYDVFYAIISQGIDAHLEAFTHEGTHFEGNKYRLNITIHPDESGIFLRRFVEHLIRQEKRQEHGDNNIYEELYFWLSDVLIHIFGCDSDQDYLVIENLCIAVEEDSEWPELPLGEVEHD